MKFSYVICYTSEEIIRATGIDITESVRLNKLNVFMHLYEALIRKAIETLMKSHKSLN